MKVKSITFRCSPAQFSRLEYMRHSTSTATRTEALSAALEEFLDFVEQADARAMNLFELVEHVDGEGNGPSFAEQA